ncbi:MAG: hypothetical protein ACK41E_10735, partial [Deinococcales bacterium]
MAQERGKSIPILDRAFPGSTLPLQNALPLGERLWQGLHSSFAELPKLCLYLDKLAFDGALLLPGGVALVLEGKIVNACAAREEEILWGDAALLEFSRCYSAGSLLEGLVLERPIVHALSGLQDRPWRVNPTDGFTGARVSAGYMIFLQDGNALGRVQTGGRETGAYPAALRPKPLTLPRVIGAWASDRYALTLRGRDAVNPITDTYNRARAAHGKPALEVLALL